MYSFSSILQASGHKALAPCRDMIPADLVRKKQTNNYYACEIGQVLCRWYIVTNSDGHISWTPNYLSQSWIDSTLDRTQGSSTASERYVYVLDFDPLNHLPA